MWTRMWPRNEMNVRRTPLHVLDDAVAASGRSRVAHLGLQGGSRCFDEKSLDLANGLLDLKHK